MQGVWFRDSTRREAERLGISGYAKNLPSGDVEVLASGTAVALGTLARWLQEGPPLAIVSEVVEVNFDQTVAPQAPAGFKIH